jgi:L-seryl-tRNA(Ser) seleniumtransferase
MGESPQQAVKNTFRAIPSVDRVLRELGESDLPRPVVVAVVRRELASVRAGAGGAGPDGDVMVRIHAALDDLRRAKIQPVINATGVIIHTNFGRSPLGSAVVKTLTEIASNYNNLEYDLTGGGRGGRAAYLEHNLAVLCEAEAATVVNNCAAALVLILRHFASKPPRTNVVISRGELVQIGGGFRIPEILEASGATLREIGTTNKTTIDDYRRAIDEHTAMVLKVHQSNFYMGGFVDCPATGAIATAAREKGVPFVEDLGSGATFETARISPGAEAEPTPAEVLSHGADLVCFSGDKLLGGPQAGIIAGGSQHVAALKKEPFFRALRCDKLILSALQTTVDLLLSERCDEVPIRKMMGISLDELRRRGERIVAALKDLALRAMLGEGQSQVGGGSLPRTTIPSITVDLLPAPGESLEHLAAKLRSGRPPLAGYLSGDRFKLDLRTVFESQDETLVRAIRQ